MADVKEFTIDRSRWARGAIRPVATMLQSKEDGSRCCLGFFALACGYTEAEIEDRATPINVVNNGVTRNNKFPQWLVHTDGAHSYAAARLMSVNDTAGFLGKSGLPVAGAENEAEREKRVAEIFADNGVVVKFVDKEESNV
jgi:hypothetical protein